MMITVVLQESDEGYCMKTAQILHYKLITFAILRCINFGGYILPKSKIVYICIYIIPLASSPYKLRASGMKL